MRVSPRPAQRQCGSAANFTTGGLSSQANLSSHIRVAGTRFGCFEADQEFEFCWLDPQLGRAGWVPRRILATYNAARHGDTDQRRWLLRSLG